MADHSFRRPRPDLTADIGTPNACSQSGCQADKPLDWVLKSHRDWYGRARLPHYGTTFAAARNGAPGIEPELRRIVDNTLQPVIVRATALSYLQRYAGEVATAASRAALTSDEPLLRHVAASALAEPDIPWRVKALAPLLSDPVKAVGLDAVSSLAGAPPDLLKPYQRDALRDGIEEYERTMTYSLDFASSGMNLGNLHSSLGDAVAAERYYGPNKDIVFNSDPLADKRMTLNLAIASYCCILLYFDKGTNLSIITYGTTIQVYKVRKFYVLT